MSWIEDYGLIGDTRSAGLVSVDGSIDWLCLPRFDAPSCFGALLDAEKGGRWTICPTGPFGSKHRYRDHSMVLETLFTTESGSVRLIDCLALEDPSDLVHPSGIRPRESVVRVAECLSGEVAMRCEFSPRFDYGDVVPWFRRTRFGLQAVGGPDALDLCADVEVEILDNGIRGEFVLSAGQRARFVATYHLSHLDVVPHSADEAEKFLSQTDRFWTDWAKKCSYRGKWRDEVIRSLLVLKALTFSPTGGVVAAPTTSLPEVLGGVRNWDYRFCWLRDATFTLDALLEHGYTTESQEWVAWLLRAAAGDPEDFQIMYSIDGRRRLPELELPWLSGYEGSRPVRVGNAAATQLQLDVYGELMDAFHDARRTNIDVPVEAWELQRAMVDFVCAHWREPDEGIWEVRSGRKHFVHSKVMAWVALDRAVKAAEEFARPGPVADWVEVRDEIRAEVLAKGYNDHLGYFVRAYDEPELDASLLMLPLVGFIPADDPRMLRTIEAIERDLSFDGLLLRYRTDRADDGLPPGEGAFLMCSFWLVDCLALIGRNRDAEILFEKLLKLKTELGLFAEQYDPQHRRMLGNFPQAFSHIAVVNSAQALESSRTAMAVNRGGRGQTGR